MMGFKQGDKITPENCGDLLPGDIIRCAAPLSGVCGEIHPTENLTIVEPDSDNGVAFRHPRTGEKDCWYARSPTGDDYEFIFWASADEAAINPATALRLIQSAELVSELVEALQQARNQVVAFALDTLSAERAEAQVFYIDAALAKAKAGGA